ncbi:16S rRNA (cytosine(1402)-N(4))-methyltransferase RsmH [Bacteroidetes/Chlorobi group bacterium MS-B_bin-24]|jgi:16S rRNA (cytosine1402-N4)-methyltransferase|nr:MAG: 16S rRNA (cytosine(1402)-N(4))-methyltransferase RsmH [Bacteroidetes/Chlorobi group bacterium MS-B_bin-24]
MDDKLNVYHTPVLLKETIDLLFTKADGIYIDGTIGGGGHSEALLAKLSSGGKIFGFDKDPEAIEHCKEKFKNELEKGENSRIELFNECFSKACSITRHRGEWTGFLLDLGVSSRQLDESRRGFSYRAAGPLDLRFSPHGRTAEDLVNAVDEEELAALLRKFGEEPFAKKIARRIVQQRKIAPIRTTIDLARIVESVVPRRSLASSLSRVSQALRIAINDELNVLHNALHSALQCLGNRSRIVVISYHSLEDRIVKNFFRQFSKGEEASSSMPKIKILTKKPLVPSEDEVKNNPRSRSAKLRAGEVVF